MQGSLQAAAAAWQPDSGQVGPPSESSEPSSPVGVAGSVHVGVAVGLEVGVAVGVAVGVEVGVAVGVGVGVGGLVVEVEELVVVVVVVAAKARLPIKLLPMKPQSARHAIYFFTVNKFFVDMTNYLNNLTRDNFIDNLA